MYFQRLSELIYRGIFLQDAIMSLNKAFNPTPLSV